MPRKARTEVEGGLYHVITRGNNRRRIFDSPADHEKFLSLLGTVKVKLPFFLYAYCLMSNHVHLLIERQTNTIGRIMHRLLTGYARYYNRRHQRVGHLLQGRYKAILCQSDRYLSELVRYIHLNPVRAGIVDLPEDYEYSSHRAYLGMQPAGLADVDPILRHFGSEKRKARELYRQFVDAGMRHGHREEFYEPNEEQILGNEEFIDAMIHRIGQVRDRELSNHPMSTREFQPEHLLVAVERNCRLSRVEFCSRSKSMAAVRAKEMLILAGLQVEPCKKSLCEMTGISLSSLSRRIDAARLKLGSDDVRHLVDRIVKEYRRTTAESHKSQA